jgi:FAD/FMN-containing dehydrogenase
VSTALEEFATEVGSTGPVRVAGGRTQWDVGGPAPPGVREVTAPAGAVDHQPAEMLVRVGAGATLDELRRVVRGGGQDVALESGDPGRATVGGILAVGQSGFRRLGHGPVRDAVLEVTAVNARGELIRSGAPLVKNVTGFDLCRLLVGSLGTLALLAEVVLRCRPLPQVEAWWMSEGVDPFASAAALHRPLSVLWDGTSTWVGLAGYEPDVMGQAKEVLGAAFTQVEGPPARPGSCRRSLPPGQLRALAGPAGTTTGWLAEIGVGVVHCTAEAAARLPAPAEVSQAVVDLHRQLKVRFDPDGRLNPGRSALLGGGQRRGPDEDGRRAMTGAGR